jgi:hypothetical protein
MYKAAFSMCLCIIHPKDSPYNTYEDCPFSAYNHKLSQSTMFHIFLLSLWQSLNKAASHFANGQSCYLHYEIKTRSYKCFICKHSGQSKVKQSHYVPCRCLGKKEVELLLIPDQARGKILLPLPGIEPRSPSRPVRSQRLYWLSYPGP